MPLYKDYIYLAGIIDGEGTIRVHKANSKYYRISLRVASTSVELITHLKDVFGGTSWRVSTERQYGNNKESFCWEITGKTLYNILNMVEPYCIIKKTQVFLAKEYVSTITRNTRLGLSEETIEKRDNIIKRFSLANRRGALINK